MEGGTWGRGIGGRGLSWGVVCKTKGDSYARGYTRGGDYTDSTLSCFHTEAYTATNRDILVAHKGGEYRVGRGCTEDKTSMDELYVPSFALKKLKS